MDLDGVKEAKEECKHLEEHPNDSLAGPEAYRRGVKDGYKSGFKQAGHKYTWLLWLRDLIVEFFIIIAIVLTIGLMIGHWKADRTETFAASSNKAKLVRRRTMMGLEHIGILKGEEYHARRKEQHQALISELAS